MTVKVDMKCMMMLMVLAVLPMAVDAALPFGRDKVKDRTSGPACLSGITFEGGDLLRNRRQ